MISCWKRIVADPEEVCEPVRTGQWGSGESMEVVGLSGNEINNKINCWKRGRKGLVESDVVRF